VRPNQKMPRWTVIIVLMLASAILGAQSPLTITTESLPKGVTGLEYSFQMTATGGTPPYSFGYRSGYPAEGLHMLYTGTWSGRPTAAGSFPIEIAVVDSKNVTVSKSFSVIIEWGLNVTCVNCRFPDGYVGTPYVGTVNLTVSGGVPPYRLSPWRGCPSWYRSADGQVVTGTPTQVESYDCEVMVADAGGRTGKAMTSIRILEGISLGGPSVLPNGFVGRSYITFFPLTGPAQSPLEWTVPSGSIPSGLTLTGEGILQGQPTTGGYFSFQLIVKDAVGRSATNSYSVEILPSPKLSADSLADGKQNQPYSQQLKVTGGTPGYTFSMIGGSLPPGITLAKSGGLSGTPTLPGLYKFTVEVTDTRGVGDLREYSIRISVYGTLSATPATLNFANTADGALPPAQSISVGGSNTGLSFSLIVNTSDGGKWLSATPITGATNATLTVSVNPTGLANGTYTGNVYVTSGDASNSPQGVKVTLVVTGVYPNATILNGASFSQDAAPIAPGSIATAYGSGFPAQLSLNSAATLLTDTFPPHLPTTISDVTLKINGTLVPLFFAGAGAAIGQAAGAFQVNFQVPLEIEPGVAKVEVLYKGAVATTGTITVSRSAPGVFSLGASGKGQAAALNSDGSLNGDPAKPVVPGTAPKPTAAGGIVIVYATGAGAVLKDYSSGRLAAPPSGQAAVCDGSVLYATMATPVVTIGGKSAEVLFSGLAPCYVGLWQLNIRVPADLVPGLETPMAITLDQQTSNATTVAIQ
jgi:uncharacterized protein (TIGR03437 family)